MNEYVTKQEARTALLQRAWKPNEWHDIKSLISSIPPADVRTAIEIDDAVDEAIRILNAINTSGRLNYGDYCELHDAICSIWIRGENNAEMG